MKKLFILLKTIFLISNLNAQKYIILSKDGQRPESGLPQNILDEAVCFDFSYRNGSTSVYQFRQHIRDNYTYPDKNTLADSVIIYVRGGTYYDIYMTWTESHPDYPLKIVAFPGERPIFDGRKLVNGEPSNDTHRNGFFLLDKEGKTNYTLEGLTIRNYETKAVTFSSSTSQPNRNNYVIDCTFERIGTEYPDTLTSDFGFSALGFTNSNDNKIIGNTFSYLKNKEIKGRMHAIYLASSSDNQIKDNFIEMCGDDPIRIRNASNNNIITGNHIDRSGIKAFVSDWYNSSNSEVQSHGTILKDNVFTFPHPDNFEFNPIKLFQNNVDNGSSSHGYSDQGNNKVIGYHGDLEKITAVATGDVSGDGIDEIFVAFKYKEITKIVRSQSEKGNHLSKVIYYAPPFYDDWVVNAMVVDDFDNNGTPELITAFNTNDLSQVFRGDGINSALNLGKVYENTWWHVEALTSGDLDNDGIPEVITGYNASSLCEVKRGNGVSSLGNFGKLFQDENMRIKAITSGDFDGDHSREIICSFDNQGVTEAYRGDGISETYGATNLGKIYEHSWWEIDALSAGNFDSDTRDEVFTVYNGSSLTNVKRGNGTSSLGNLDKLFEHQWWQVSAISTGNIDSSGQPKLVTAYYSPSKIELKIGDGINKAGNLARIYENYNLSNPERIQSSSARLANEEVVTALDEPITTNIKFHPNPAKDYIVVKNAFGCQLTMSNTKGKTIMEKVIEEDDIIIPLNDLQSGIYYIHLKSNEKLVVNKILIEE